MFRLLWLVVGLLMAGTAHGTATSTDGQRDTQTQRQREAEALLATGVAGAFNCSFGGAAGGLLTVDTSTGLCLFSFFLCLRVSVCARVRACVRACVDSFSGILCCLMPFQLGVPF